MAKINVNETIMVKIKKFKIIMLNSTMVKLLSMSKMILVKINVNEIITAKIIFFEIIMAKPTMAKLTIVSN